MAAIGLTLLVERGGSRRTRMDAGRLETLIREAIPGAEVEARDLQGGDHFEVTVVSDAFENASLVARHRKIYGALGDAMRSAIHALTIRALTRAELESERAGSAAQRS